MVVVPNTSGTVARTKEGTGWTRAFALFWLVLQPVIFFWHVLVNPTAHVPYDIEGFHLPLISYVAQSVRHGIAPLWDPYTYGGMPIYADSQAQVFYPFTWLAILAGNHSQGRTLFYWVEMLEPLHMALAGLFAFWLLRRMGLRIPVALFGATVYELGAFFSSQAQHLGAVCSAAWLPLSVLAVWEMRRQIRARWVAVLGLAVAMSILAGFMATTLVTGISLLLTIGVWLALREASWRVVPAAAAGILLGALISSVELIPLWQLAHESIASLRGAALVNGGGLPLESLVSFVWPNFYHIFDLDTALKLHYNFTFLYTYCGLLTAALVVAALFFGRGRERAFLAVVVVCAFWMLGEHTPVYHSIFVYFPSLLRGALYAEYALMAFCFFVGVAAALMLDRFGQRLPRAVLWAVALFTSYDLIHTSAGRPMNTAPRGYQEEDSEYGLADRKDLTDELRMLVNQTYPPTRVDYLDDALEPLILGGDMLGIPTSDGDNPFMLRRILYVRRVFCGGAWWERKIPVNRAASPVLDMFNAAWIVGAPLPQGKLRESGLELHKTFTDMAIYRNPGVLPRFFLVSRLRRSPDESTTFRWLADPAFHPAEEAVVEGLPDTARESGPLATAPVTVTAYTPNRVQLAVRTSGRAFLVTSEPMYAGWEAKVNGKLQPIRLTNGAFRGLALPAGSSEIVMEFHPPFLGLSLFFSSILALAALVVSLGGEGVWRREAVLTGAPARDWNLVPSLSPPQRQFIANSVTAVREHRVSLCWLALFIPAILLFYWKILLTRQFSLLTEPEGVNQSYAWLRYWVYSIRHGVLPLWDPYVFAGRSFAGEMQTAAFYPLHLLLALFPMNRHGLLSPYLYHAWWAGVHLLGAWLMFLLIREFGLSLFAGFIAGICFSLGGFVSRMGWPHMLESSIWLPLIFLFLLRALRAYETRTLFRNASLGGLALGMSILAGGFHLVILQVLVIVSAAGFYAAAGGEPKLAKWRWRRAVLAAGVLTCVGAAAGAIQLLPSAEYSARAIRFLGPPGALPANEKIPYQYMKDALLPHGIVSLLLPIAFNGITGSGEVANPYFGVFPLLAAVIGIRRYWTHPWVRYLAGLAVVVFLYSFGPFSWLNGVLYAIVPKVWMAREAPRALYLANFALAVLAAFGIDTLFLRGPEAAWPGLNRILLALVIACALVLFVPAVLGKPEISPWI
ncbi:MAG: YfhO family protein, partial [Acidobacteriia bacterium]|nr:YfhO family protein [Terriglobia bacterium]